MQAKLLYSRIMWNSLQYIFDHMQIKSRWQNIHTYYNTWFEPKFLIHHSCFVPLDHNASFLFPLLTGSHQHWGLSVHQQGVSRRQKSHCSSSTPVYHAAGPLNHLTSSKCSWVEMLELPIALQYCTTCGIRNVVHLWQLSMLVLYLQSQMMCLSVIWVTE